MDIEQPPTDVRYERPDPEGRRGLVLIHTGDGKGKSTAAFCLALRAHGRGKAVKIYQFMKVPSARFGEHRVFEQLGVPIEGLGDGFSWKSRDLEHSAALALAGWQRAEGLIRAGEHFLIVLDEIGRAALPTRNSPWCRATSSPTARPRRPGWVTPAHARWRRPSTSSTPSCAARHRCS